MFYKRILLKGFGLILSLSLFHISSNPQVRPNYDSGAIGLAQILKRLQTTASAMHTGAHPDDEDSGLLAFLARKEQARTVYLALTRGDGGQNVIGEELSEQLGVIRSEELQQGRRLDGGEQMFTRVMDYGFSKTRAEAVRIWGEELALGDMVRAIRLFRPLVIISRFSGTPADGHGQHQLAGYLTPKAFRAAADPKMFPEHFQGGLMPWQAKKLYVGQGFRPAADTAPSILINTGEYDSIIGRSYFEIAMEGRSQHKTQEMGVLELRGRQFTGLRLVEGEKGTNEKETSVFDGLDTSIKGIAELAGNSEEPLRNKLAELQETAETALKSYDPYAPGKLVPLLAKGYKQAIDAEWSTRDPDSKFLLRQKAKEFVKALQLAGGIVVDAVSDTDMLVAGDATNVAVRVFAPENSGVGVKGVSLNVPKGWAYETLGQPTQPETGFRPRNEDPSSASFFKLVSPQDAKLTQPYWLEKPRNENYTFDWSADDAAKNLPFQQPFVNAKVTLEIGGQEITVEREVQHRFADDIRGELRRDLNIVPLVAVGLVSNLLIAPVSAEPAKHRVVMTVTNNSAKALKGTGKFNVPAGWTLVPASAEFSLAQKGDRAALSFEVVIPAKIKPGAYDLTAEAAIGGSAYNMQMKEIAYPHIQTHRLYSKANVRAQVLDLKISAAKIAYIMGTGDKVPQAIERLGLRVEMLDATALSTGDLSQFDTIVVGIRASQVRPDYVSNNGRLRAFMENGGVLLVQYQQPDYVRRNLPPFPARMDSNIRTVDENALVKILEPANPVFNFPNKITESDFANWVQERNLYTLTAFDGKYTPLLETHDEGEPESKGGMVYAEVGKGIFIYTSYSWFRQLPAGNPGAYRILANLLSLRGSKGE